MMRVSGKWMVGCAALLVSACTTNQSDLDASDAVVRWGSSFGMCAGYCREELEVTGATARLTRRSQVTVNQPDRVDEQALSDAEWRRLADRMSAADIEALQEVYGCPDCADGGAEWVELESGDARKRVTFEYGKGPAQLQPALAELRALRQRFPPR